MVPSGSTTVIPIIRSRNPPKRTRNEPLSFVARMPPTVARSGHSGSRASCWPCCASVCCNCWIVHPASTLTVRSAQACSSTRFMRCVESTRSARAGDSRNREAEAQAGCGCPAQHLGDPFCRAWFRNLLRLHAVNRVSGRCGPQIAGAKRRAQFAPVDLLLRNGGNGAFHFSNARRCPPLPADAPGKPRAGRRISAGGEKLWWDWRDSADRTRSAPVAWCRDQARRTSPT